MTRVLLILLLSFFLSLQKAFSQEETNYHNTLALTLAKKGMLDEAISEWKKVIEINPSMAIPHYNLGLAYHKKGMLEEAISEYKKATEQSTGYTVAYYNLGNAYYQKGLYDQALSQWQKVLELDPKDEDAKKNIQVAQGLSSASQSPPTVQALKSHQEERRPEATAPTPPPASSGGAQEYFNMGIENLKTGKIDDAIKSLEKVVAMDPRFPNAYTELGRAYHKKNMVAKARAAYQRALALNPNDKKASILLNALK